MNPRYYIIILSLVVILSGGILIANQFDSDTATPNIKEPVDTSESVFCTQDAKECEDGSFVSRVAPSCDFAECPDMANIATTTESSQIEDFILVKYDGKEFSPNEITVEKGDKIRFLNESSRPMWIGSDLHPTHGQYPEKSEEDCLGSSFDQCGTSDKGEYFEFIFNSTGTWGYHNHISPSQSGTITVK